jgi:hypothetical protein
MKPENPRTKDMFEKAREAFFETAKKSPKPSDSSAESLKPQSEPAAKKSPALPRDSV